MNNLFENLPFRPADILLPRDCAFSKWSVVACDQYTSQPEYWQRVEEYVGRAPSTLRLILPESCLEGPNVETDIMEINNTMSRYLREGRFEEHPGAIFYVERTLDSGRVRRGLIGVVDLEQYDYEPGSSAPIRATEGTVLSRIPPRVAVRKNAPIELPHVMLLMDDREKTVIEPLSGQTAAMKKLYDFDLMERGGHIRGWELTGEQQEQVARALSALADPASFHARYGADAGAVMLFAVGDGNHSLATAKECYERQKRITPQEEWADLPARYALVELNNLHDDSLEFEPIHRVVFGVEQEELLDALCRRYPAAVRGAQLPGGAHRSFSYVSQTEAGEVALSGAAQLAVGALQDFLDDYAADHLGVRVDYIHGEDVARRLAGQPGAVAFLLPVMGKEELFPAVLARGALPRKSFSMGEAHDKRFYLEARRIRA